MKQIIEGKLYNTETATLIASNRYWDGSNFDRGGTNTYLYKSKKGNLSIYSINKNSPILNELRYMFIKTDYLGQIIKNYLKNKAKYVFIYGSFAKGEETQSSDIDLFVIGEIREDELIKIIQKIENTTRREINYVLWNEKTFLQRAKSHHLLKTIKKYHFPCHILTKSNLVLRDIDLLSDMQCVVTISITSLDKNITHIFEENAPSSKERLQTVETLIEHGIKTGLALMPVLPFIVESELEDVVKAAKSSNVQYLLHKHLELKGNQKRIFEDIIQNHYPHLLSKYDELYKDEFKPDGKYIVELDKRMHKLCKKYNIPERIFQ